MQVLRAVALVCALASVPAVVHAQETARGTVFLDRNRDGRLQASEPPLPGIRVSNGREVVLTGDDGRYELPIDDDDIVFVIKPRGYLSPIDDRNLSRFYYMHNPAGAPQTLKYAGVDPTGPLPQAINFPLLKHDEPDTFRVLVLGDPQAGTLQEVDYFAQDVVHEVIGIDAAFGVVLGDLVNDDLELFEPMAAVMGLIGIPWYNVFGNHDQNYDVQSDALSDETWERVFGPPTYAFDWGPVHFIVIDNVMYDGHIQPMRSHPEFGPHLEFIENDLRHVPKDQLVVLMMHIPIVEVQDREKLFALLAARPHTLSLSSHWHIQQQFFLGPDNGWLGDRPHHHLVQAAACGSWWNGTTDERGIPHTTMRDGVPNGYSVITFNGKQYSIRFKAARRPADEQMAVYVPSGIPTTASGITEVRANVYAGTERSRVEMRIDKAQSWLPMRQANRIDPDYVAVHALEQGQELAYHQDLPEPQASPHFWVAYLPPGLAPGTHVVEVRARDMFGQVAFGRRVFRVEPVPSAPTSQPAQAAAGLHKTNPDWVRVMTHNMLWDGLFDRPEPFQRMLRAIEPDIICFQEVRSSAAAVAAELDRILPLGATQWQAHGARGTLIASRWPLIMQAADTVPVTNRGQAMSLVDLPDDTYEVDLYVVSAHFKCCGNAGGKEDRRRQTQSDANINWFRDLREPGGNIDLPFGTPFVIAGDLNMVGGLQPLHTLLDGNIINEDIYGADSPPDWDGTQLSDPMPVHHSGAEVYTWRSDGSPYPPGRLDLVLYSDSVMRLARSFVLNTLDMDAAELAGCGLHQQDTPDASDHLPIVVDFDLGVPHAGGSDQASNPN